jgi:hypothetical protein
MRINFQNVEDLIFHDKNVWKSIPDLIHLRDQWRMSKMSPILRALGRKSLLDFLRSAKKMHEDAMSMYFNEMVTIDKIERHLVKNIEFELDDEAELEFNDIYSGFSVFRKKDKISITFWR